MLEGNYFAYAPDAAIAYQKSRRLSLFLDYQYQFWPSFAGPPSVGPTGQLVAHDHGLSPNGFSFGVKYRVR
jgi:hypothetical protein